MAEQKMGNLDIELDETVAQGHYSNLVIISHSTSEFILDFATVLPGLPKAPALVAGEHHALRDQQRKDRDSHAPAPAGDEDRRGIAPRRNLFKQERRAIRLSFFFRFLHFFTIFGGRTPKSGMSRPCAGAGPSERSYELKRDKPCFQLKFTARVVPNCVGRWGAV